MKRLHISLVLILALASVCAATPASFEPARSVKRQVRWYKKTIQIAISNSLVNENISIRPQSDVVGAIHRALASWSAVTGIEFVEVSSDLQSISPAGKGDGISLITIAASPQNIALFRSDSSPARTRVFYDSETGEITEADIALNPYAFAVDGSPLDFSTDGTIGTYDLESILAHEVGHFLGLGHSNVFGATMNGAQALNGLFGLPAFSGRTLSDSDRAAALSIYGDGVGTGSIEGHILNTRQSTLVAASSASVWIEDSFTGRVAAAGLTDANGDFKIGGIPPGTYRVITQYADDPLVREAPKVGAESRSNNDSFRSAEIAAGLRVLPGKTSNVSYVVVPPQNAPAALRPRFIGTNVELSTVALPANPGSKTTVFVSGDGIDQISSNTLMISSPYLTVDPGSVAVRQFTNSARVLTFDVTVAVDAPNGDYSLRLQAASGELAYLIGAITVQRK